MFFLNKNEILKFFDMLLEIFSKIEFKKCILFKKSYKYLLYNKNLLYFYIL